MNKALQVVLSLLLIIIAGGLIYSGSKVSNSKLDIKEVEEIAVVENLEIKKDETIKDEIIMDTETKGMILKTNQGDVKIELYTDKAPKTVGNFVKLASDGFYDGIRFHRVIKGFMVQTGDPLSKDVANQGMWGTGGPGYSFEDEFGEGLSNVPGTLSMANSGPNTNGSQFFINTADNVFLDGKHAVFGKVVEGMDIVTKIENTETGANDQPAEDMVIESVELF